jgi:hypothetical protein
VVTNDPRGDAEEVIRSPLTSGPGTKARSRQRSSRPGERWPEDRRLAGLGLRAGVTYQLSRGLARARDVSRLGASHGAWSRPAQAVEITVTNPGLAAATGGLAGGSQPAPGVYQISLPLLCAGKQQGALQVQKTEKDGGTSGCEQVRA